MTEEERNRIYDEWKVSEEGQAFFARQEEIAKYAEQHFKARGVNGYMEYLADVISDIQNNCPEIAALVQQDSGINPNPQKVVDFFMDEVSVFPLKGKDDIDELIRFYAKWRKEQYYAGDKWAKIYNGLVNGGYIRGATLQVFSYAMDNKTLPPGTKKIKWLTSKADTLYLKEKYGFTVKQLNSCFDSKDGKPLHWHNRGGTRTKRFLAIFS